MNRKAIRLRAKAQRLRGRASVSLRLAHEHGRSTGHGLELDPVHVMRATADEVTASIAELLADFLDDTLDDPTQG